MKSMTMFFYQICIEDYSIFENDLLITKTKLIDFSSGNYESETDEFVKFHVNLKNLDNSCYNESVKYLNFFTLNKISDLERRELEEYCHKLAIMDAKNEGKDEGKQAGIDEGKQIGFCERERNKQIEIAKKMLNDNLDINLISKYSGLSIQKINNLI